MDTLTDIRLKLQLLGEELDGEIYRSHTDIGSDYSPEVLRSFENAIEVFEVTRIYLERITSLLEGTDDDNVYLNRLLEDLEAIPENFQRPVTQQSLNQAVITEILQEEIANLKTENKALKAQAALLEEIPMCKPANKCA
jgi:hypothetical protein